ncbi:MAG: substrate-binding domain-containing protein [Thermodesulfobacteriota bacterium]
MRVFPARWPAVVLLASLFHAAPAAADSLTITGNGGSLAAVRLLADAYMKANPETRLEVLPVVGTTGGVRAVLAGRLDIGVAGRQLTPSEKEAGAVETPFARSPFVFCGHRGIPTTGLTSRGVTDIYAGRMTAWPDGTPVRLVLRPEGDSDTMILRGMSREMSGALDGARARPGMIVAQTDMDAAETLESVPGAFGVLALGMAMAEKRRVKVFTLDGAVPGAETLASGSYPHEKRYAFVTLRSPAPAVRRFLDFTRSREAKSLLSRVGFLPLR